MVPENPIIDESYSDFRNRVFGMPYDVWHDGPIPRGLSSIPDGPEREHARAMLTEGVVEHGDDAAVEGWADFDPEEGIRIMKPLLGKATNANFVAAVTRFLNEHDTNATDEERVSKNSDFVKTMKLSSGASSLDSLMTASEVPTKEVVEALLDRVAHSPEYLERYHAAESLLKIGKVKRTDIASHNKLFSLIVSRIDREDMTELENNNEDWKRYALAAKKIRAMLRRRRVIRPQLRKIV